MIRNAIYTVYEGTEYRIFRNGFNKYILVSHNKNDESKGFIKEDEQDEIYLKEVSSIEVGEVYNITTFGYYEGHLVVINSERENTYCLGVPENQALARKLGFEEIDRGVLRKWVPKEKVERIYEEKRPILHFFSSGS